MSDSLPTKTQVLVVGSGPNGMACAIRLASLGLQVTLVDALPGGRFGARASLVHPHTLEELDTVGLAKPLLEIGIHATGVTFHSDAQVLMAVDVSNLGKLTQFPTTLLLSQNELEKVFYDRLVKENVKVHHGRNVVGMKETNAGVHVSFEDGATIVARYVVGADGSKSTIRSLAAINFQDPHSDNPHAVSHPSATTLQLVLSDLYLENPLPPKLLRTAVSWHLNPLLLLCPIPDPKDDPKPDAPRLTLMRVGIVVQEGGPPPPRHLDKPYLQAELDKRNPWAERIKISSVSEAAMYRVRSAVATTFFKKMGENGYVLLVGDAAHVHSPTGGQGMNLGLCDAMALGRAIHRHADLVAKGQVGADDVLVHYSTSRQEVAKRVMGFVKKLTRMINLAPGWKRTFRNAMLWIAGSLPFVRNLAAWRMSGLVNRSSV